MPRLRVIILDQHADDTNTYNIVLWADVPTARQSYYATANANYKSAWSGATAADNTNIQTGLVSEQVTGLRMTAGSTAIQFQVAAQNLWTGYQNAISNNNYWFRYGSTWDGTTWVLTSGA